MDATRVILLAIALGTGLDASAQTVVERPGFGPVSAGNPRKAAGSISTACTNAIVQCADARQLADSLGRNGIRANIITSKVATVRMATAMLPQLYLYPGVESVQLPRTAHPSMVKARSATGADRVQNGDGLDSPYTGKGVVIGVIDEGFEYKHVAFLKDDRKTSRVVGLWNRRGYAQGETSDPIEDSSKIPATGDGYDVYGHATHVTNIAAGSRIPENDYWGMAPDADIVMIPSDFSDAEVLEDIKFVQQIAAKRNAPWVINMSFGTQIGAHDGTSAFSRAADEILTSGNGREIVIAAGNENVYVQHAQHTFKEDGETVRLLVSNSTGAGGALIDLWGQQADGQRHLIVRPFLYVNGKYDYKSDDFWNDYEWTSQIASFNNKEHYFLRMRSASIVGQLGFEITGEKGVTFHAWTNNNYGNFEKGPDDTFIEGDTNCCVDDFGASIDNAVVAAAYVTSNTWTDYNGKTQSDVRGEEGNIANFSSHGPSLSAVQPCKPTVAAPGSCIVSAVAKTGASFDVTSSSIASVVKVSSLKRFYYEQMSGTSMASPAVTGIIALWLQANPALSCGQILDIIKATSTKDSFTGNDEWNATWGYGKINAYEGLKEALRLGSSSGVPQINASAAPVTILHGQGTWKLLFGSNEPFARVEVFTLDGRKAAEWNFGHLACGDEKTISFNTLASGAYIVRVSTANCQLSRKLAKT